MFQPFPECPELMFGRVAARSDAFAPTCASGGAPVVIGSAAGSDAHDVVLRARGELFERVSNILAGRAAEAGGARIATFEELRRTGAAALDPAAWPELVPVADLRQTRMLWTAGQSLLTGEEILVPASAAYLHHRPPPGCVRVLRPGSTGVSAHASRQAAARHALLEVLERDLAWRSWYRPDTPASRLHDPPLSPLLSRSLGRLGVIPTVLVLQGPASVGCIVVCVHTAERREQSFGARCVLVDDDASLRHGIEAAVYEALMVRWSMTTPVAQRAWRDMERMSPPALPCDPLEHALWTFHRQDSLGHWLARAVEDNSLGASSAAPPCATAGLRWLAHLLAEHTGSDVVAVDTTVPTVCSEGVTVVRVVAPGARRLPADERDAPSSQDLSSQDPGTARFLPHPFG